MNIITDGSGVRHIDITRDAGEKFFVLADVHAFYNAMTRALEQNGFDAQNPHHKVILLGDMLDRGDAAKQTFEFFKNLGDRLIFIKGNHEDLLVRCVDEFLCGLKPQDAHFLNGTVDTLMQLSGITSFADYAWIYEAGDDRRIAQLANRIDRSSRPVLDMIDEVAVDYATLDDYIFVHGYIPCFHDASTDVYSPIADWKHGDWSAARWAHGTQAWHDGVRLEGKTIVIGHWHTSEAHARYHSHGSEWEGGADFSPFVDDGIIALDACTAYSGICNCLVL